MTKDSSLMKRSKNSRKLPAKYRLSRVVGEEVHYKHEECKGNTGNLYVRYGYKDGKVGWYYHCHSCGSTPGGLSGFYSTDQQSSPRETLDQLEALMSDNSGCIMTDEIQLPDDITYNLPRQCFRYMSQYGLSLEEIKLSRFGWSPYLQRMIMPVYQDGKLVYWQGRNLGEVTEDAPKYKNVYLSGSRDIYCKFHCRGTATQPTTLVIVEAIVSAIKISRHADCIALLGSYIPPSILEYMNQYDKVCIWLDPDKKQAAIKAAFRYSALTMNKVVPIISDRKPKQYSDREILWQIKPIST